MTGGNRGLGLHLVRRLAAAGATAVLTARDRARDHDAAALVAGELFGAAGHIEVEQADVTDPASLRALAERLGARPDGLHALVNNAAQILPTRPVDHRGVERHVAVNHLGPFLLTTALLPALTATAAASGAATAVVNVSSASARFGDTTDLQSERKFGPNRSYGTSKLANLAASIELAHQLDANGTPVRIVSVDPGGMRTGMGEDLPGLLGFVNRRIKPNQQPIERTARTVLRAALDAAIPTGAWLDRTGRPMPLPRSIRDAAVRRRVWQDTERLLAVAAGPPLPIPPTGLSGADPRASPRPSAAVVPERSPPPSPPARRSRPGRCHPTRRPRDPGDQERRAPVIERSALDLVDQVQDPWPVDHPQRPGDDRRAVLAKPDAVA